MKKQRKLERYLKDKYIKQIQKKYESKRDKSIW